MLFPIKRQDDGVFENILRINFSELLDIFPKVGVYGITLTVKYTCARSMVKVALKEMHT